jgi:hypothetical protein
MLTNKDLTELNYLFVEKTINKYNEIKEIYHKNDIQVELEYNIDVDIGSEIHVIISVLVLVPGKRDNTIIFDGYIADKSEFILIEKLLKLNDS